MKNICIILLCGISMLYSCTKKSPNGIDEALNKPQFDFDSQKIYSPSEVTAAKMKEKCDITPYWEGKSFKMQGYIFYFHSDTLGRRFHIYDTPNPTLSEDTRLQVVYDSSVDKKIKELFVTKTSQQCTIKVSCVSEFIPLGDCYNNMSFKVTKLEDIEFK